MNKKQKEIMDKGIGVYQSDGNAVRLKTNTREATGYFPMFISETGEREGAGGYDWEYWENRPLAKSYLCIVWKG